MPVRMITGIGSLIYLIVVSSILPQAPRADLARQRTALIGNASFGLDGEMTFRISAVRPGSAAARSGLRANDLVLAIGGSKLQDIEQIRRTLLDPMVRPGTKFEVTVGRPKPGTAELETIRVLLNAE